MNAKNPRTAKRLVRRYAQRRQPRHVGARLRSAGRRANPSHPVRRVTKRPYVLHRTQHSAYTNKERRKVARYKRGRKYYSDYRAAWNRNPDVAAARKAMIQAFSNRAHTAQSDFTRQLASEQMDAQIRRGLDPITEDAYRHYATNLWKRVGHLYGGGKMPKLNFSAQDRPGVLATAKIGKPETLFDPENHRGFLINHLEIPARTSHFVSQEVATKVARANRTKYKRQRTPAGVRYAVETRRRQNPGALKDRSVLLHEWAHTRQGQGSREQTEGGAAAFEDWLAHRLWGGHPAQTREYRGFAHNVRKKKGRNYILHGQFR